MKFAGISDNLDFENILAQGPFLLKKSPLPRHASQKFLCHYFYS